MVTKQIKRKYKKLHRSDIIVMKKESLFLKEVRALLTKMSSLMIEIIRFFLIEFFINFTSFATCHKVIPSKKCDYPKHRHPPKKFPKHFLTK